MKGFTQQQVRSLKCDPPSEHIRTRSRDGREYPFVSGWYAIHEANRIFGTACWDRETLEIRNVVNRENRGQFLAVYVARVRIRVRANGHEVLREGHGSGEAKASSPGEAHDIALKSAETDATKRALATFGHPFGLGLYLGKSGTQSEPATPKPVTPGGSKQSSANPANTSGGAPPGVETVVSTSANLTGWHPARSNEPIDKSVLSIGAPKRYRDKAHLRFVAAQPCLLCGRSPSDAHHLRFAQLQALGRKVSDEYTVPLCRLHHRQAHQSGKEATYWEDLEIDVLEIARTLWRASRTLQSESNKPMESPAVRASEIKPAVQRVDKSGSPEPNEVTETGDARVVRQTTIGKSANGRDRPE